MVYKKLKPEVVVGVFIFNKQRKLLMVKQSKWSGLYLVPGGHVELGESLENAVKREVREEVGLKVDQVKLFNVLEGIFPKVFYKKRHFIYLHFKCKTDSGNVKLDKKECDDFLWVKLADALKMHKAGAMTQSLNKLISGRKDLYES